MDSVYPLNAVLTREDKLRIEALRAAAVVCQPNSVGTTWGAEKVLAHANQYLGWLKGEDVEA